MQKQTSKQHEMMMMQRQGPSSAQIDSRSLRIALPVVQHALL